MNEEDRPALAANARKKGLFRNHHVEGIAISLAGDLAARRIGNREWPVIVAYHEGGHATMATAAGWYVYYVTTRPDDLRAATTAECRPGGYTSIGTSPTPPPPHIVAATNDSVGVKEDLDALDIDPDRHGEAIEILTSQVEAILEQHWHLVAELAFHIQRHRRLEQAEIESIIGSVRANALTELEEEPDTTKL